MAEKLSGEIPPSPEEPEGDSPETEQTGPTVPVPEGFEVTEFTVVAPPTKEEIEEIRQKFAQKKSHRSSAPLMTRHGDSSYNDGGGKRRRSG